jgi:CheY-like chemotaxis protein
VPSVADPEVARRGRILAIDDEPAVGATVRRMLQRHHDVTVAHSGREALAILERGERFDVILCDLMMPEISGMDVHAQLVRRDPAHAGRMVFVTGGAFTASAQAFLDGIGNRKLAKPFGRHQLIDLVGELVGG